MQWAGVGMWMVLGLSACSPTKTEIGNLNVIPQPQEVSQDIQAHPFVINPQTGIVYPEGNEKLQRTAEFLASYIKEATGITVRTTTEAARKNSIILAVDGSITNKEGYQLEVTSENIHLNGVGSILWNTNALQGFAVDQKQTGIRCHPGGNC